MNRQYFIEKCFTKNGKINKNAVKRLSDEEIKYLMNLFDYVESINEALFRIKHNIEVRPVCKVCGNKTFFNGCVRRPYSDCCSQKCADIYRQQKIKQNSLEKYGVDHPAKTQENIDKHIRYYKEHNIKQKLKDAVKRKYGVDNVFQLESVKDKSAKSCLERYGVDNAAKSEMIKEKMKNTCIKKYGVDVIFKADSVKEKIKKTCLKKHEVDNIAKSDIIKEKTKETDFRKYGCYHITLENIKYKNISKQECIERQINSLLENGTINSSKPELESYELIKEKYCDVIHQYRDKDRYPFNCDFYIPSLDLFIECQYGMFHNGRPYIGNEQDLQEIELFKGKSIKRKQITGKNSRYDAIIETWSIRDVKKRKIAKENKLNFIEFWTINELKNWLEKN